MVFDPPAALSAAALARSASTPSSCSSSTAAGAHGACRGSDSLWALEQALKSGHVGAVLAWLPPRLRAERLRRLQLAAHQHDGAAFVLREIGGAVPADGLAAAPVAAGRRRRPLAVRMLKRRGPPLTRRCSSRCRRCSRRRRAPRRARAARRAAARGLRRSRQRHRLAVAA